LSLSGADFGQPGAFLGRFNVQPGGEIYTQICDGDRSRMSCGLARYNGRASTPLVAGIVNNRIVEPPDAGIDGLYSYVKEANGTGSVLKVTDNAPAASLDIRLQPASDPG